MDKLEQLKTQADLIFIFKNYKDPIYKFVYYRLNRNQQTAEDIAQEVFIRAWKYRESFDSSKSKLKTWLFNIAINQIKDLYAKNKTFIDLGDFDNLQEKTKSLDDIVTDSTLKEYIYMKLKGLKEEEQELLILRYFEHFEIEEIAKIKNKNYPATKVAINRAFNKLKNLIQDENK